MNAAQGPALDTVEIGDESPLTPEAAELFALSDAYAAALYPAESNHMVDAGLLAQPNVIFCVARQHGGPWAVAHPCCMAAATAIATPRRRMRRSSACTCTRMRAAWDWVRASWHTWNSRRRRGACVRCAWKPASFPMRPGGSMRSAATTRFAPFGDYWDDPLSVFLREDPMTPGLENSSSRTTGRRPLPRKHWHARPDLIMSK